LSEALDGH